MFRFGTKVFVFFCLWIWKGLTDNKKVKRLSKKEIKRKLLDSIIIDKVLECEDLNKQAEEVQDLEKAADIIKRYEDIIIKNKFLKGLKKKKSLLNSSVNEEFTKILLFLELMFLICVKNTPNY